MAKLRMHIDTKAPPERVREALLDFSERRPDIWPGLAREFYDVYRVGETDAEIREGTIAGPLKVWAREHYDWSKPNNVTWTVLESNFSKPGSYLSVDVRPGAGGGSSLDITWERWGSNFKGKIVVALLKLTHGKAVTDSIKKALVGLAEQ